MKKPWFHVKKYGWGYGFPATWQGWIVFIIYVAYIVNAFYSIDVRSHSVSDTLINFIPRLLLASLVFIAVAWVTSGKPKWCWGNKK